MVHPILLIHYHLIPSELLDNQIHLFDLSIHLRLKRGAHLELQSHALLQGSPKLAGELWVSIRHNVLGEAMMLEHVREEQPFRFWAVALSLVGMKCAILLNRSTTTMITSNPLDGGKLTMKSMDTFSHGPLGIDNGRNNRTCFF